LIVKRLIRMALVAFGVVFITFSLIHLVPGNPAQSILGDRATPASVAALERDLHLNVSLPDQFWIFISHVFRGNLGTSLIQNRSVSGLILQPMLLTLWLIAVSVIISAAVGVPVGLLGVPSGRKWLELGLSTAVILCLATPPFVIGFVLLLVLAVTLHLAPAGGWGTTWFGDLSYIWLPALALSGYLVPVIARVVRQRAGDIALHGFIEAAVARGLSPFRVIVRHVLPNTLLPLITVVGLNIGALISGAVIIEIVFNLPGIGTTLVLAVLQRDYPVVQGIALLIGMMVVVINTLTDLLYLVADPRTRGKVRRVRVSSGPDLVDDALV
jgi:peptide/nickel transport system permease protein